MLANNIFGFVLNRSPVGEEKGKRGLKKGGFAQVAWRASGWEAHFVGRVSGLRNKAECLISWAAPADRKIRSKTLF
jgi:hypothetical protein